MKSFAANILMDELADILKEAKHLAKAQSADLVEAIEALEPLVQVAEFIRASVAMPPHREAAFNAAIRRGRAIIAKVRKTHEEELVAEAICTPSQPD